MAAAAGIIGAKQWTVPPWLCPPASPEASGVHLKHAASSRSLELLVPYIVNLLGWFPLDFSWWMYTSQLFIYSPAIFRSKIPAQTAQAQQLGNLACNETVGDTFCISSDMYLCK
jgi:hypothetical protein